MENITNEHRIEVYCMEDLNSLVHAIDKLTEAVRNSENTYIPMIISTALATIGSIVAVLVVDAIKNRYIRPTEEFEKLRRKINSTLSLYACYYTNQIDIANSDKKLVEQYSSAADTVRMIAVELRAFVDDEKRKKYKKIGVVEISTAASNLMGLSNSFFTPYNCPGMTENMENRKTADEIRKLLGMFKQM